MPTLVPGILYIISGAILLSVGAADTKAQDQLAQRNPLSDTIRADNIILCSDLPEIDSFVVEKFMKRAFPGRQHPIVIAPRSNDTKLRILPGRTVYYFVAGKNPTAAAIDCLDNFPDRETPFADAVAEMSEALGKKPARSLNLPHGDIYGPVKAQMGVGYGHNWTAALFLSIEGSAYRTRHTVTWLFGLADNYCDENPACNFLNDDGDCGDVGSLLEGRAVDRSGQPCRQRGEQRQYPQH